MRVLLIEDIHPDGVALLKEEVELVYSSGHTEEAIIEGVRDAEAIIIRNKGAITERVLKACPKLRAVARHGVGVDNIDVKVATRMEIPVLFTPGTNTESVAEHAIMLMLAVGKRLAYLDREVRRGGWWELRTMRFYELKGLTLGLVGLGRIGSRVAQLARAFDMEVLGYDPYLARPEIEEKGAISVDFDELLRESDIVSLHLPLLPETRKLMGKKEFEAMKEGSVLINTARGGIVDERALYDALVQGGLMGAGLDTLDPEPPDPKNPLLSLDNVIITPHMAAHSESAMRNMAICAAEQILKVLKGERPTLVVNPEVLK